MMPEATRSLLQQQIDCGREGINEVTEAISKVDSAQAKAWKAEDEAKVKSMIQERRKLYKDSHFSVKVRRQSATGTKTIGYTSRLSFAFSGELHFRLCFGPILISQGSCPQHRRPLVSTMSTLTSLMS